VQPQAIQPTRKQMSREYWVQNREYCSTATIDAVEASQRVGDRYYVPRNLTILADLKARRGRVREANALYEQAEDVIESMLISVDDPYWNSSVAASFVDDANAMGINCLGDVSARLL
jgi:hypothetical protein